MSDVIDLSKARLDRTPHIAGVAICAACSHEWAAAAPTGTTFLKCPECGTHKARFMHPVLLQPGQPRLACHCGCQVFSVSEDALMCINCGEKTPR